MTHAGFWTNIVTWGWLYALWTNIVSEDDMVHWFYFMNEYCYWGWLGTLVCTLWTNIVNEDDLHAGTLLNKYC